MLPPELVEILAPAELAEIERLVLELPDEASRRVAKAIIIEKIQTGRMETLRYIKPALTLREYLKEGWHVVEPGTFISSWHTDAICDHLEAVSLGQIRNLIINVPPRCSKSTIVSVMWPTWTWTFKPTAKWLFSSYDDGLATVHSWEARLLLQSSWYQSQWSHIFQLVKDQNQKTRYDNTKLGYRKSTSVGAAATGFGGDIVVCDDPNNVRTIESETQRLVVTNWWDKVMSTRLNDINTGSRVIIQQRCHQQDLTGHVLEKSPENWVVLKMPMEFESAKRCTIAVTGWSDPREKEGELLCPARFSEKSVAQLKVDLGQYDASGQLQQEPAPPGGGMFQRKWFKMVDRAPNKPDAIVRFWDMAATEAAPGKDPDWTVGTRMSVKGSTYYVEDVRRGRWSPRDTDEEMYNTAEADGKEVPVREEQEGGSSGKKVIASNIIRFAGWDYQGRQSSGSKKTRAKPFAIQCEGGNVCVVRGEWNTAWFDELAIFDRGKHDDQVDSGSGAFNELIELKKQITVF